MALYVCLMVYTGLSLFIIRQANVYLVVCVLTRITLQYQLFHHRWNETFEGSFCSWEEHFLYNYDVI